MSNNKTIFDVYRQTQTYTDKYDLGYLQYFYSDYLKECKSEINNFLEIGVSLGGSMKLWRAFFDEQVEVVGVDVQELIRIEGCTIIKADAYCTDYVDTIPNDHYDLIVDDGEHTFEQWMKLIDLYFDKIPVGGRIIIEDVIPPFEAGKGANESQRELMKEAIRDKGYSYMQIHDLTGKQQTTKLQELWKDLGIEIWELRK
jgi:hypothetical protein